MNILAVENLCKVREEHLDRHRVLVKHLNLENERLLAAQADELLLKSMLRELAAQAAKNGPCISSWPLRKRPRPWADPFLPRLS